MAVAVVVIVLDIVILSEQDKQVKVMQAVLVYGVVVVITVAVVVEVQMQLVKMPLQIKPAKAVMVKAMIYLEQPKHMLAEVEVEVICPQVGMLDWVVLAGEVMAQMVLEPLD
jgi:hypothetical protein